MNVDYFRFLELAGNFLNFRLCEIQLVAQCLLGEHGPLKDYRKNWTFLHFKNGFSIFWNKLRSCQKLVAMEASTVNLETKINTTR